MSSPNDRTLTRDCEGTLIPAGEVINLPMGTEVTITHRLGGNFTVVCDFGMFRIMGKDADALGEEVPEVAPASTEAHEGPPNEEAVWEQLKSVFDPEIPVNIVDLGLVYSMQVNEPEPGKYAVLVHMTLTAPGCGMGPSIAEDAKQRILTIPGVSDASVELVWDPPWTQDMISEEGKMQLGLI
tara:strand:+ start:101503 stop:102051 length:549 start_codon:yes stop_codon:yes gene_type:complete